MWNLIKMDFYRLFTAKTVRIGAIVSCAVCVGYMLLSLGAIELAKFATQTSPEALLGIEVLISQVGWINGVDFATIVFGATSVFALFIGCMITASFVGSEQSCSYAKNYAGRFSNKGYLAISKFIVTSVAQVAVLVIYVIMASILAKLLFNSYIIGYDIDSLLLALGLRILLHLAINSIILFVCTLTKSHAIAMVVGCIFGIGVTKVAYFAIDIVLSTLKIDVSISQIMPDGINSVITVDSAGDMALKTILSAVAFAVVFLVANCLVLRKRDVR